MIVDIFLFCFDFYWWHTGILKPMEPFVCIQLDCKWFLSLCMKFIELTSVYGCNMAARLWRVEHLSELISISTKEKLVESCSLVSPVCNLDSETLQFASLEHYEKAVTLSVHCDYPWYARTAVLKLQPTIYNICCFLLEPHSSCDG